MMVLLSVAGVVLLADQCSKLAATSYAAGRRVAVGPLVALRPVRTTRPSFSRHTSTHRTRPHLVCGVRISARPGPAWRRTPE